MAFSQSNLIPTGTGDAMRRFQLEGNSATKSDNAFGSEIARYIESTVSAGVGNNYYYFRNSRYKANRDWSHGRIDIAAKFSDKFQMNGKTNYMNMSWSAIHIANTIISRLVGRWMQRNEKISVTAIDSLSVFDKVKEFQQAEFHLYNKAVMKKLQEESGAMLVPANQFVGEDQDDLDLWRTHYQRIPEEILYEEGANDVLSANGFFDVNKEKCLRDSAEVGFVGTYTWMDEKGRIQVEWVDPENAIYGYSKFNDLRDSKWKGRLKSITISELRKRYGKQFGGQLTEEDIWNLAATCKEYQKYDMIRWQPEYDVAFVRPYDEWNLDTMEFEVKTLDTDTYKAKTTSSGRKIIEKNPKEINKGEKLSEDNWNIYRGVYARTAARLLEWGIKKNMIRPQDPTSLGDCEYSYSFFMYNNNDMRNIAVPEKIEEPMEQMILARLKMQQLVMRMIPVGAAIDEDALRELDYGLGEKNREVDPEKHYFQTGRLYYRGKDAEGNRIPVPITELKNSGFIDQLQGLILIYDKHYQILKDELGEDPNLITAALQPRVTAENVQASQGQANAATDYMYNAYLYCMEETAKKISCLLHDSVMYGSQVYRKILQKEDISGRVFSTKMKMLPDSVEIAKFEAFMNQAIAANKDLILYINPFKLMQVARENVKMSEQIFNQGMKRMLKSQSEQAQQNQQATVQGQIASAQAAEQAKQQTEQIKGQLELEKIRLQGEMQNKNAVISMVATLYSKVGGVPPELQDLMQVVKESIMIPLFAENQQGKQALTQALQAPPQAAAPQNTPEPAPAEAAA